MIPKIPIKKQPLVTALRAVAVLALLFIFLIGIKGLGSGFKLLGKDVLDSFFAATENPFVGLVVGILATTVVQSSSVTTSMIVGLVAAPLNPLPLANAIPMIMGANIGTTVTNSIVSFGHAGRRDEFRKAFAVATCHDFFNFGAVLILLPLEMATGILQRTARGLSGLLTTGSGVTYESPLKSVLKAGGAPIKGLAELLFDHPIGQAIVIILLSGLLIFLALMLIVKLMRSLMQTRVEAYVSRVLGRNVIISLVVGAVATVLVQSSSITTSLLVPLAAAGLITLRQAFPITLGANIGTTITALLASLAVSGQNAHFGVEIALVHLWFNVGGILLILPFEPIRELPLRAARWLADTAVESRPWAIGYVVGLFFLLPAALIFVHKLIWG